MAVIGWPAQCDANYDGVGVVQQNSATTGSTRVSMHAASMGLHQTLESISQLETHETS